MINHKNSSILGLSLIALLALSGCNSSDTTNNPDTFVGNPHEVQDDVIAAQRAVLASSIVGKDVGAQSPRDIDSSRGSNTKATITAPASTAMYLCDIHFHKSAEHKGGQFTTYAGNGDGHGYGGGYKYSGTLTEAELATYAIADEHNPLYSGDTIETHYVYSSNPSAELGNGLGTCLSGWTEETQPLLRVETQVYVLVNDEHALDFEALNHVSKVSGRNQAEHIPSNTGTAIQYEGSTTGPSYNEKVSPLQVSWSVRPNIAKVNIETVENWFHHNDFDEHHGHAVRNLVINLDLLSQIK